MAGSTHTVSDLATVDPPSDTPLTAVMSVPTPTTEAAFIDSPTLANDAATEVPIPTIKDTAASETTDEDTPSVAVSGLEPPSAEPSPSDQDTSVTNPVTTVTTETGDKTLVLVTAPVDAGNTTMEAEQEATSVAPVIITLPDAASQIAPAAAPAKESMTTAPLPPDQTAASIATASTLATERTKPCSNVAEASAQNGSPPTVQTKPETATPSKTEPQSNTPKPEIEPSTAPKAAVVTAPTATSAAPPQVPPSSSTAPSVSPKAKRRYTKRAKDADGSPLPARKKAGPNAKAPLVKAAQAANSKAPASHNANGVPDQTGNALVEDLGRVIEDLEMAHALVCVIEYQLKIGDKEANLLEQLRTARQHKQAVIKKVNALIKDAAGAHAARPSGALGAQIVRTHEVAKRIAAGQIVFTSLGLSTV